MKPLRLKPNREADLVPQKTKDRRPKTSSKPRASSQKAITGTSKWIRIEQPFILPDYVKSALQRLDEAGHIAYVVGGCVRDFLLRRSLKDYDIATSADPDELCRIFPHAVTVGKSFGVIKVPYEPGKMLEVATFRKDLEYKDHRHPVGVLFSGPEEDAKRRDFTVNALFFDPKTQRILDSVEGFQDLKSKTLRAIGNPEQRFEEDALRLLRAVRFSSVLGFEIEPKTAAAIKKFHKLIRRVSAERVRDELTGILVGARPSLGIELLREFGLIDYLLPELTTLRGIEQPPIFHFQGDVWSYTLKVLDTIVKLNPQPPGVLCWGALLHEIGKPLAFRKNLKKNFNGHEQVGVTIARAICDRMRMSKTESHVIRELIEDQLKFKLVFEMREATLQRWMREPHFKLSLALHRATALVSDGNLAFYEFCASRLSDIEGTDLGGGTGRLVDGDDLIQLGFQPGPAFSRILRAIEDLTMERKLLTKKEALEYVIKNFVK